MSYTNLNSIDHTRDVLEEYTLTRAERVYDHVSKAEGMFSEDSVLRKCRRRKYPIDHARALLYEALRELYKARNYVDAATSWMYDNEMITLLHRYGNIEMALRMEEMKK